MPIFAAWVASAFSGLMAYFGVNFSVQVARILAVMALVLGLYIVFYSAMLTLANVLTIVLPDEIGIAASWLWPSNGFHCLSTIISAKFLAAALRFQLKQMRTIAGVS